MSNQPQKKSGNVYRAPGRPVNHKSRKKRKLVRRLKQMGVIVAMILVVALVVGAIWGITKAVSNLQNPSGGAAPEQQPGNTANVDPAVTPGPDNGQEVGGATYEPSVSGQSIPKEEERIKLEERGGVTYLIIDGHEMILVNKDYSVPQSYGSGTVPEADDAYFVMKAAAAQAGYNIYVISDFRSYETQESIHNRYLNSGDYSVEYVKQMSAEPGHSEHQLGLAYDIGGPAGYDLSGQFGETETGKWLAQHAHEYGFILRYMEGKTWATGYMYEPWHFRYVGKDLASIFYESGLTVEEYAGLAQES